MVGPLRVLACGEYAAWENMATDEAILEQAWRGFKGRAQGQEMPPTLRFYQWRPSAVSIGYNQSLSREVDENAIGHHEFDVVRRITGGGAVFHQAGAELTYSVCGRTNFFESAAASLWPQDSLRGTRAVYAVVLAALQAGLARTAVQVEGGTHHCPALFLGGRKVSGNAQVVRGAVVLQHGTLLLAVDPELMYTVLRAPEGVPPQRVVASVRAKVAGIVDTFPHSNVGTLVPQLCSSLAEAFGETLGLEPVMGNLTPEEQGLVQHLSNKYRSPEWLARIP